MWHQLILKSLKFLYNSGTGQLNPTYSKTTFDPSILWPIPLCHTTSVCMFLLPGTIKSPPTYFRIKAIEKCGWYWYYLTTTIKRFFRIIYLFIYFYQHWNIWSILCCMYRNTWLQQITLRSQLWVKMILSLHETTIWTCWENSELNDLFNV